MALPEFVSRRGERLYYRRAFPKELWPVTGKAAFAVSLQTTDPKEALRSRPEAERQYSAKVDQARAELARRANLKPLSKADAEALAVRWFLQALDTAEDFTPVVLGPERRERALEDAEWALAEAKRALAEGGRLSDRRRLARCLREEAGLAEGDGLAEAALLKLLGRAAVAAEEVYSARLKGDYGARPTDLLFASALQSNEQVKPADGRFPLLRRNAQEVGDAGRSKTLGDLEKDYRRVKLARLRPGTVTAYAPVFRLLKEVLGEGSLLHELTHEDGERLFEMVRSLPANAKKQKALEGLSIPEAVEEGKRLGLPTLSAKTVNDGYMAQLKALFGFAVDRGWMAVNPVTGLRMREVVAARDKREPFGAKRLKVLFGGPPWHPRDAKAGGKPIRFWGPLLALYHGLRLGEVAGLELRDIIEEDGGPVLLIRDGTRPLKTKAARRDIPLHPELVRMGFPRFVEQRRKAAKPGDLLFNGEEANGAGKWGVALGRWFIREVQARELEGRKLTFHALRHDFRDALREAEVEPALADYIMGHSQAGVGAIYGAGKPSLARLRAAIERVRYTVSFN
jgi:integrase